MSLTVSDDGARARYAGRAQAIRAAVPGGALTVGLATLTLDVPAQAGETAEGFTLTAAAEAIAPSEALWRALDPEATLERGPGSATLALDGRARAPRAPGLGRPVTVETVRIETFRAEGLDAEVAATGELALREGGGVPSGALSLAAAGWGPALDALERAGIAPPAQAALVRGLAERLNAPDAPPGAFFSEIALRGGMVFANGVRVR